MASRRDEFQRQVQTLVDHDYPALAGLCVADFVGLTAPLQARLDDVPTPSHGTSLPFAVVVASSLVPAATAMDRVVDDRGKRGVVDMTPVEPGDFEPRQGTELPAGPVYLIADVDTGKETLNVRPRDALGLIEGQGRLPLTIDEGVAIVTQFPDVLRTHNAFQLLASRRDDKRIPSIWTSSRRPRLGWCWDGNPHSWLGSASAAARLG